MRCLKNSEFSLLILWYTTVNPVAKLGTCPLTCFTSAILFFIISSREAVTSSVITGAGLTLCSKSSSTSMALFLGLLEAVTYKRNTVNFSGMK
jgi:hypothetical protein